jgi:PAS domain S-box-containing protein
VIHSVNLAGAALAGIERAHLMGRRFSSLVHTDMRHDFDLFLRETLQDMEGVTHREVMLVREGRRSIWVRVEAKATESAQECRMAVFDVSERKDMENALLFLLEHGWSGEDFFRSLARYLAVTLDMDYVCIDRLEGDCLSARTVAVLLRRRVRG